MFIKLTFLQVRFGNHCNQLL